MTLYQLVGEYKIFEEQFETFCDMVETGELPEEAILDTLDAIAGDINEKLDNIACIYKKTMYEAAMIKAEEARLRQRRKVLESGAERLKDYMDGAMQTCGIGKLETARNRITFRKSERVVIDDEDTFITWAQEYSPELLTFKVPEPNRMEIKKILKIGTPIEGCRIEACNNLQVK